MSEEENIIEDPSIILSSIPAFTTEKPTISPEPPQQQQQQRRSPEPSKESPIPRHEVKTTADTMPTFEKMPTLSLPPKGKNSNGSRISPSLTLR
jgi:hypothetical protein